MEPAQSDTLYVMRYVGILQDVVKIGRSVDPGKRRKGLEAGHNFRLEILAIFPGRGHLEPVVHRILKNCRSTRGSGTEWFCVDLPGALEAVAEAVLVDERGLAQYRLRNHAPLL